MQESWLFPATAFPLCSQDLLGHAAQDLDALDDLFIRRQFADMINDQNSVYGMVIDMPINPVTLSTLVVYINAGNTSVPVYFWDIA